MKRVFSLIPVLILAIIFLRKPPGFFKRYSAKYLAFRRGGVAVAYIFLHLFPELHEEQELIGKALEQWVF
ncbi:MAG TPA: hypothetical protein VEC36_08400 [Patescibacteria group bacterium]|nr:hypothetical protein [Patescibacteria group bacterium]